METNAMMAPEVAAKLRRSLILHEGYRKHPYLDTSVPPRITIGIGYDLTDRGIDDDWINSQFNKDVNYFHSKLSEDFPWYSALCEDRQIVLIDMAFMGYKHFCTFHQMFFAIERGNFKEAAIEMLNSEWSAQVKGRAVALANAMLTGIYEI